MHERPAIEALLCTLDAPLFRDEVIYDDPELVEAPHTFATLRRGLRRLIGAE